MDTVNALLEAVTRYGFPVVMCLLVWRANQDQTERITALVKGVTEALGSTSAALEKVSAALAEIKALLVGRAAE